MLREAGHSVVQYTGKQNLTPAELVETCLQYDALLSAGANKIDDPFLQACHHLKGIALFSVGYDSVDVEAATRFKIPIGNTPGVLSAATADVAFLLLLAVSRKAFFMNDRIKKGEWDFYEPTAHLGRELNGMTLGILGLGRIGLELAKRCKGAYGMDVIYHNRTTNTQAEQELCARWVSFDELLRKSDVLSVHSNLSAETYGLFDKVAFSKMKPTSIFVNTARGGIHNEVDLTEALQKGIIWGAGLDVTHPEPMSQDNPLLQLPNVCVLPHIGSATMETRDAMAVIAAENLLAVSRGERMPHCVNPEVYG